MHPFPARCDAVHINIAITQSVTVRMTPSTDTSVRVCYRDYRGTVDATSIPRGTTNGRWEPLALALARQTPPPAVAVDIASGGPHGAGLGFSGTLLVACLAALARFGKRPLGTPREIAEKAFLIENSGSSITGKQDHYAASYGGIHAFTFSGTAACVVEDLCSPAAKDFLAATLSVVHAPGSRRSADVVGPVASAIAAGDAGICDVLERLNELHAPLREAISTCDQDLLARSFRQVLRLQLGLADNILDPALGAIVNRIGAFPHCAAKLLGAGGPGGSLLVAHAPDQRNEIDSIVRENGSELIPVTVQERGVTTDEL